ncbi:MAG: rRNA pseudouridine synthase [Selenomonadaceae bacterium]|nr:rRNA pseudouridine synthase [Selenomonadaceae bacterium]
MLSEERLQKLISRAGLMSRREAEDFITAGRVTVDGKIVSTLGARADAQINKICVDGQVLHFDAEKVYLLLNKPEGFLSAAKDKRGCPTVMELVKDISTRVYPCGRLDLNSSGLILMTNDGELMNRLIHPKFKVPKTYRVKVEGELNAEKISQLQNGVELDDGLTAPAEINLLHSDKNSATLEITIHEGRNRQIRRMLAAVGCGVKKLVRINFAGLTLDGVAVGKYRHLTADEVKLLYKLVEGGKD